MSMNMLLLIIGMAAATYSTRVLPFLFFNAEKIPPRLEGILKNVPYAALGALIFPGALFIHDHVLFGIIGIVSAFVISFLGGSLIFVVLGSILVLTLISPLF
ncbi:AzlD domain-containing protein [Alteribacillus iranensis]|uniref:Branched-chain amino acid transport protein n=1 Tax=Alteribacillus iranensis TaxID=930128 RepID=A0A1I2CWR0_9BACI|nr:AzlD domain-containing protein [Alteribacillus iranensis]SFE72728.1 Branched-chain amino acid transport protein [Alteribacillus iranensis]